MSEISPQDFEEEAQRNSSQCSESDDGSVLIPAVQSHEPHNSSADEEEKAANGTAAEITKLKVNAHQPEGKHQPFT